jgi:hypothetical protein
MTEVCTDLGAILGICHNSWGYYYWLVLQM